MEKFDPNRELQIWQRVAGGPQPENGNIRPLLLSAVENAAVLRHLTGLLTGKARERMKPLQERGSAVCGGAEGGPEDAGPSGWRSAAPADPQRTAPAAAGKELPPDSAADDGVQCPGAGPGIRGGVPSPRGPGTESGGCAGGSDRRPGEMKAGRALPSRLVFSEELPLSFRRGTGDRPPALGQSRFLR